MATTITGMDGTQRVRGLQYKYRAYCFNGRNRMRKWDGMGWQNAGIAKASFTPSVAAGSAGGITGTYRYYVVPVNSTHTTLEGLPIAGLPSAISDEITVTNQKVVVSSIPATHADAQVDKWNIYRNRNGYYDATLEDEIQDFYLVGSVTVGTTTFTDTIDDDSVDANQVVRFNQNIPATFKYAEIFGERMFGCGFDPISAGTATAAGAVITFSGVFIPDGVVGCWFKKAGDTQQYRILSRDNSYTVTLDRSFSGTCSAASYSIYRYPYEIYISEFGDPEAGGPDGEAFRWKLEVPGMEEARGICTYSDTLLVFTLTNIYAISGKGPNKEDIRMAPYPLYAGLGAVSGDAIWRQGDDIYFLSLMGPAVMRNGGPPELCGWVLGRDWITALTDDELKLCRMGGQDDFVWVAVPRSGETSCSRVFRLRRSTSSWWEETGMHPSFWIRDNGDDGRKQRTVFAQDRYLFQGDSGTTDMTPTSGTAYSGTLTSAPTALSAADSGATFPTTGGGLQQCYVHFYRTTSGVESYLGSRRITSNTATSVTWLTGSGTGQGSLALAAGDRYEIGRIAWTWMTQTWHLTGHDKRELTMQLIFSAVNALWTLSKQDYVDGTAMSGKQTVTANEMGKVFDLNLRDREYYTDLGSRTGAVLQNCILRSAAKESFK